jgi:alkanesulfonate monooxygenase SsuD/methylene tetrahydromethanopterin reductase-like flavin-dependent oxidoreductase (luciferase family)
MLEAYTLLGAIAARTERVLLGTLVTGVTYRNPAILAKIVTTLDVISRGRAYLGIGAAWFDVEHRGLGVEFPRLGDRMDMLEEALQICRAMFREERPTFEGRHYRTHEAINSPPPVRAGGPPIMIGGSGAWSPSTPTCGTATRASATSRTRSRCWPNTARPSAVT